MSHFKENCGITHGEPASGHRRVKKDGATPLAPKLIPTSGELTRSENRLGKLNIRKVDGIAGHIERSGNLHFLSSEFLGLLLIIQIVPGILGLVSDQCILATLKFLNLAHKDLGLLLIRLLLRPGIRLLLTFWKWLVALGFQT